MCLEYIDRTFGAGTELAKKVTPDFAPYGKRIIRDPGGYYAALTRDHVDVEASEPAEVNAKGIVTQDGRQIDLDVIIYATGYHLDFLSTVDIRGREGRKLADEWGDSPRSYRGGTVPGFPNLFINSAPNYSPGHGAGANFSMEVLAHYIIECLQLMALRGATTMEVTQQAYETTSPRSTRRWPVRCGAIPPMRTPITAPVPAGWSWPRRTGWSTSGISTGRRLKSISRCDDAIALRQNGFGHRQQPRDRQRDRAATGRRGRHSGGDGAFLRAVIVGAGGSRAQHSRHHRRDDRTDRGRWGDGLRAVRRSRGREARDRLVDEVLDRTGRIDILVNNAGFADYSAVEDMAFETFDRTVEHYLRTPFVLTKAAARTCASRERGWIVNIGSVTGVAPVRPYREYNKTSGDVIYASMKAALHRFTQGVAAELLDCQHRSQLCRSVHRRAHSRCGAVDSGCLSNRARGIPRGDRAGDVPSARRRAHRVGGVQPALSVVAEVTSAQSRRERGAPAAGAARDGQPEHLACRPVAA